MEIRFMGCNAQPPMEPAPWGLLPRNPPPRRWVGAVKGIGLVEVAQMLSEEC